MAKSKKKQKKKVTSIEKDKMTFKLSEKHQDWIFIVLIVILCIFQLKPLVIDGLSPQGVDSVNSLYGGYQTREFEKKSSETPMWNPYIFAGSPAYHGHSPEVNSIDTILNYIGKIFNSNIFAWYLFGAIGLFLLLRYFGLSPISAFLGSILFVMMPHYQSLWITGHNKKLRAIMVIPWSVLSFRYFLKNRSILGVALFALFWGIQIRTGHYQIIFYTALLIFTMGVYPFIKDLLEKKWSTFFRSSGLLVIAIIAAMFLAAQPLFLTNEYLPYSKRGKTTVDIHDKKDNNQISESKDDGVTFEYATNWSTHPSELITWIIPGFYGGMSAEKYQGSRYPHLKGREIPMYWGSMPMTQSSEYFGVITILLAIIGIYWYRKNLFIRSMLIFSIFLILLSFGRHFDVFYRVFYNYFPYFNKFRAPMMSVTMIYFIVAIFAAIGVEAIKNNFQKLEQKDLKIFYYLVGAFITLGVILLIASQQLSYLSEKQNYDNSITEMLKNIRYDYFLSDIGRYFILLVITVATIIALINKKINVKVFLIVVVLVSSIDLLSIQNRKSGKYIAFEKLKKRYLAPNATNKFINQDDEIFRVFPVGNLFQENRWSAFHQSIGGYSPQKMNTIEEIIQNNLYQGWEKTLPINWNILQMLNVKYLILSQAINHDKISLINIDKQNSFYTYKFNEFLPRGFFVSKTKMIKDVYDRLEFMNTPDFKPSDFAIIENELPVPIYAPDQYSINLLSFSPNKIEWDITTDKQSLFYISDTYYPPVWKAYLNEKRIEIYKSNHNNMSVIVPEGIHKLSLTADPDSYNKYVMIERITAYLLYTLIIGLFIFQNKSCLLEYIKRIKK